MCFAYFVDEKKAINHEIPERHETKKKAAPLFLGAACVTSLGTSWGSLSMADAREGELVAKVQGLVASRFQGNYRTAFDHYGAGGRMDEDGLERLLKDAGVGNFATRGTWVRAILDKLDGDRDGFISFAELQFLK